MEFFNFSQKEEICESIKVNIGELRLRIGEGSFADIPPPFEEKEMFGAREENFHIFFSDGSVRRELERILNHSDAWRSTGYLVKGYLEEREQREEGYRGGGRPERVVSQARKKEYCWQLLGAGLAT